MQATDQVINNGSFYSYGKCFLPKIEEHTTVLIKADTINWIID